MGKMTLYEVKGTLMQCCGQSHIRHSFFIEEDLESLHMQLNYDRSWIPEEEAKKQVFDCFLQFTSNYSPKTVEALQESWMMFRDVRNLVTLSLDDNEGFRGASHRGKEDVRISILPDSASEGYIKGIIPKGTVSVTISVHALVKDCPYHFVVETD